MLNNEQLQQLFIDCDVPLIGRRLIESIRKSEPTRRVGGGLKNVVTRFASQKMGCVIQAESHKVELPALYLWEHDPNTLEFYDQPSPVKLSYQAANGRRSTYLSVPDYFLIQRDWLGWVECKTDAELEKLHEAGDGRFVRDDAGKWRCPPGEEFAAQFGLGFQVRSDKDTNWILVRNLEFLADYLTDECPSIDEHAASKVRQAFAGQRWILLSELIRGCQAPSDTVFSMIGCGQLLFDIEHELLSEPIFTNICRDSLSAQVYLNQKKSTVAAISPSISPVSLTPGVSFLLDGVPWKVINVGQAEVLAEDEQKSLSNFPIKLLESLAAKDSLACIPADSRAVDLADQVMRKASPADLERAIVRSEQLAAADSGEVTRSARTLRWWRHLAMEGEMAFGNRFAGLVSRISARGNRQRKISAEAIQVMNEVHRD